MSALSIDEVLALLEDGPKRTHELAAWFTWAACRGLNQLAAEGRIASLSEPATIWRDRLWGLPTPQPDAPIRSQKTLVLAALEHGADTSRVIAEVTGLSIAHCSAWLSQLVELGLVDAVGERRYSARGHASIVYQLRPTTGRSAAARKWQRATPAERSVMPAPAPPPATRQAAVVARAPVQRIEDDEFEVVWNGVGPLPGAGEAAGLGSSLSGREYRAVKR